MKDQRPDKQVESLITGGACSARSQFHKAPVYIIEEGSTVPAGLRATQIKCTSCKIQRDPRARANGSEPLSFFKNFHAPYLPPPPFSPPPPLPSAARNSQQTTKCTQLRFRHSKKLARVVICAKNPNLDPKRNQIIVFWVIRKGKVISRDQEIILLLSKS